MGLFNRRGQGHVLPEFAIIFFSTIQTALALLFLGEGLRSQLYAHLSCGLSSGIILYSRSHAAQSFPHLAH